ncbi:uncharacterized protein [Amphiura filiformis]|uniref:uncharacterized protein n=1 Tax=Amphiura filiformis TaxID=82378 RepID=UPI003B222EA9
MAYYNNNNYQQPQTANLCPGGLCGGSGLCLIINGAAQVLLGLAAIIIGAVVVESGPLGLVEQIYIPIWAGCIFFVAGVIGISILCCNSNDRFWNNCMSGIFVAFCIIGALAALGLLGWEGWVASEFGKYNDYYCLITSVTGGFAGTFGVGCADYELVYYLRTSAAIIGGIALIAAIIGGVMGCMRFCNNGDTQADRIVYGADPYSQNPPPYSQSPTAYSYPQTQAPSSYGYGQNSSVYYSGQRATFQPGGYMYR